MAASSNPGGMARIFNAFAGILALVGMVFLTPHWWPMVNIPLWNALIDLYSYDTTRWLHLGGMILAWPLTFLVIRMLLTGLIGALLGLLLRRAM